MRLLPLFTLLGFLNAAGLFWQHRRARSGKKIYCLIGQNCQEVVESRFGRTFGVKNEIWGMGFYAVVLILVVLKSYDLLLIASLGGAAFSIYLLIIQSFVLKKYCSWCLIAIGINLSIFGYIMLVYSFGFIFPFLFGQLVL